MKGLGLATFIEEEIETLKKVGNKGAKAIWLGKFKPGDFTLSCNNEKLIKEFMRLKYTEKRWY